MPLSRFGPTSIDLPMKVVEERCFTSSCCSASSVGAVTRWQFLRNCSLVTLSSTRVGLPRLPRGCCFLGRRSSHVVGSSWFLCVCSPTVSCSMRLGNCVLGTGCFSWILLHVRPDYALDTVSYFKKSSAMVQNQFSVYRWVFLHETEDCMDFRSEVFSGASFAVDTVLRASGFSSGLQCPSSESACVQD